MKNEPHRARRGKNALILLLSNFPSVENTKGKEQMGNSLLVRDVPEQIRSWIEEERSQYHLTQKEFVLSVLQNAYENGQQPMLPFESKMIEPSLVERIPFTFIDLFAGIGGFRIPLENIGGRCVFSSEIDKYAQKTYKAWFGEIPQGDIMKFEPIM